MRSLDAPLSGEGEQAGTLLDQLAAGLTDATSAGDDPMCNDPSEDPTAGERALEAHWLQAQLSRLGGIEQRLLLGHWIEGLGWCELALEHKLSSRQARQRGEALLACLQENAIASSAAIAV